MNESFKRLADLLGALGGLLVFGPVMLLVTIAILVDDGRPVLFRQARLGRRRQPFEILKFRTMRDGRVTRVGARLRATGLDELPQFLNILRGDMSAVGPRPLTEDDVDRLGWSGPAFDDRWACRPGLTGPAQLTAVNAEEAFAIDRRYATGWRPWLDVRMIAYSFVVNVAGKSRVRRWLRALEPMDGSRRDAALPAEAPRPTDASDA